MNRGLSASATHGDDQRILNENKDLQAGDYMIGDLKDWEEMLTKTPVPFVLRKSMCMIDDNHFQM